MVEMHKAIRRQPAFLELARMYQPYRVEGFEKIRAGSSNDGGYVMLDDFRGVEAALSNGVETNADWDMDMVSRGLRIHQYDHSIDAAPVVHPQITWHKKMISPTSGEGCATLAETLRDAKITAPASGLLKIDIEGGEWDVFEASKPEELNRFSQILIEMHDMGRCVEDAYLARAKRVMKKLTDLFAVFHVHANNWSPLVPVSGVWFPETVEISFANRSRYTFLPTDELFPTPLDQPCNPMLPDVFLGSFRFG
jgi:hypothetical protein